MDRNTGLVGAIALALAAFIGISNIPSSKTESSPANSVPPTGSGERVPGLASPPEKLLEPCRQIASRIAQFIPDQSVPAPDFCLADPTQPQKLAGVKGETVGTVRYVIATLPDPVHTHFALLFDRLTEALQQAAQDQGYTYDGSWLPWTIQTQTYNHLIDQQVADELRTGQENQPGVVVFRGAFPSASVLDPCVAKNRGEIPPSCAALQPYGKGLIVFVVGENPTGGIKLSQFHNAVEWIRALTSKGADSSSHRGAAASQTNQATLPAGNLSELRILGPYFSGSFPSLAQALMQNNLISAAATAQEASSDGQTKVGPVPNPPPPMPVLTIFSGTTSSKRGIDWFTAFLGKSPRQFWSFQENDDLMIDRYCQYLSNLGYDTGKLAILSEDETAYGGGQSDAVNSSPAMPHCDDPPNGKNAHGPLYLYYPRDIAALRSAYEQHNTISGNSQNQVRDPRLGLPLTLTEPSSRQHDTIRSYGGEETTLSQEATLFGITNLFSAHDIQFIVLRSSNTLDQIFLTRFLSTAYPQARVVLTSADLLFRRSSDTVGFRGTMTLTTYPLATWQQDWTHPEATEARHSHRVFPEDFAEGVYVAARFLIDGDEKDSQKPNSDTNPLVLSDPSVVVQDYAPPAWSQTEEQLKQPSTQPPTWLSVIGNEQLWPVAVLNNDVYPKATCPEQNKTPPDSNLPWIQRKPLKNVVLLRFPHPIKLLLALTLLWSAWHYLGCAFGSRTTSAAGWASSRYITSFAPMKRPQQKILMFLGSLVIVSAAIVLISFTGVIPPSENPLSTRIVGLIALVLITFAAGGYWKAGQRRFALDHAKPAVISHPDSGPKSDSKDVSSPESTSAEVLQTNEGSGSQLKAEAVSQPCSTTVPVKSPAYPKKEIGWFLGVSVVLGIVFYLVTSARLTSANATPTYWRSLNPLNGVSPIMPMLLLMAGLYCWFWFTLSGLALFNDDRPRLPFFPNTDVYHTHLSGRKIDDDIEKFAVPLGEKYWKRLLWATLFLLVCAVLTFLGPYYDAGSWLRATGVRTLGPMGYGRIFLVYLTVCIGLILVDGWYLLSTWGQLRQLLTALDELPLRRTLTALKGFSWGTVWKMSGNVLEQRRRLIARERESLQHLRNQLLNLEPTRKKPFANLIQYLNNCQVQGAQFGRCFSENAAKADDTSFAAKKVDFSKLEAFQATLAVNAELVLTNLLLLEWPEERHSSFRQPGRSDNSGTGESAGDAGDKTTLSSECLPPEYVSAAEEFFALTYLGFIQNILGRIRTMTMGMLFLFVAATVSTACYPFDPRPVLGGMFLAVFAAMASVVIFVYAQMHRDATLSNITNTNPGELGSDFWTKIIAVGIGPVLGLLTALFPQITSFITSWLQPGVQAIK